MLRAHLFLLKAQKKRCRGYTWSTVAVPKRQPPICCVAFWGDALQQSGSRPISAPGMSTHGRGAAKQGWAGGWLLPAAPRLRSPASLVLLCSWMRRPPGEQISLFPPKVGSQSETGACSTIFKFGDVDPRSWGRAGAPEAP